MKIIKAIGDIIDQTKNRKIKKDTLLLELEKLKLEAEQFEKTIKINESNSKVMVAEKIADWKIEVNNCSECNALYKKEWESALNVYKKIGSVKAQFERGEDFIIQNPDKQINDLRSGNIMVTCENHRYIPIKIKELYKVI